MRARDGEDREKRRDEESIVKDPGLHSKGNATIEFKEFCRLVVGRPEYLGCTRGI